MVSDWFLPKTGGIESQVHDLCRRLKRRGHPVAVLTPTPGPDLISGIPVIRLATGRFPFFGFMCTPAGFARMETYLRSAAIDLVHIHLSCIAPAAFAAALYCRRLGIPAVVTCHSILGPFGWLLALADRLLKWSRWPIVFTTVSRCLAADLTARRVRADFELLPNGIDPEWWRPPVRRTDRPPGPVRLVTVMRLSPVKRSLALVRMMSELSSRLGPGGAVLTIVGDGIQRRELERAIARRGLTSVVHIAGYRQREAVRDALAQSDVFVMPSRRESFGIAALEACCAGLPVVAMAASGIGEWLLDGKNGLLATDDAHMVACLHRLATDAQLRDEMHRFNRSQEPPFSWDRLVARHLDLYRRAIRRAASVPRR